MHVPMRRSPRRATILTVVTALGVVAWAGVGGGTAQKPPPDPATEFAGGVRPLVGKYCLGCHSTKAKKGSLDLERFATADDVRKDLKPWHQTIEMLETGEMPPKNQPQPTAAERARLVTWVRGFMDAQARARDGDPGFVPLRRLSNAEYDYTVRDLTGVDLRPTREFPADGAAGEGFTNAAEALTDVSPALLTKYLNAAKDVAGHAVLLPDGFRFSPGTSRRDWTDESLARLRAVFAETTPDGRLPLLPYLTATVRHRDAITTGKQTIAAVATADKLNPKYLGILWQALTDAAPSEPLDAVRARWRAATEKDVPALAADIAAWQAALWKVVPVGSYRDGNTTRQVANDPRAADLQPLRLAVKPGAGTGDVVLYLAATEAGQGGRVVWQRPRFEKPGQPPLLLRDYAQYGPAFEVDLPAVFKDTAKYLAAATEAANDRKLTVADLAKKHRLDAALLERWVTLLSLEPATGEAPDPAKIGRAVPHVAVELLDEKTPKTDGKPAINGWRRKGTGLPSIVTNAGVAAERIPGTVSPHGVAVHPTPKEFVGVTWTSVAAGTVKVTTRVGHVHPACGNGVAWWFEHRRGGRAAVLAEGAIALGSEAKPPARTLKMAKGDVLLLAVDAKNGDHSCDLTEIGLTVVETDQPGRTWDLAADVADTVHAGNPHPDKHGNAAVWSLVRGPSRATNANGTAPVIPADSSLGRWRAAATDPARGADAVKIAAHVQALLSGARLADRDPDLALYDTLVSTEGVLVKGLDLTRFPKSRPAGTGYGLPKDRFGAPPADDASLMVAADAVTEVRLPALLLRDREFVVEGRLDGAAGERVVRFQVTMDPPAAGRRWDGQAPVVASPGSAAYKQLVRGHDGFRRVFPQVICFPRVLPDDEVVCLKMYHREDEPLSRLFLDADQQKRLDRLWDEHRFITRQPVAENAYLPQFIGFVTQDQPKELLAYYEGQRPAFLARAEAFVKDEEAAVPRQLEALLDFAARAYRRPLADREKADLLGLHRTLRAKGLPHDEAFRAVLARVLSAPAFLFRIEHAPAGKEAAAVNDWELAARLSYFLWASAPDDELRRLAAAGRLRDPAVLADQTRRMVADPRVRALAVEFGTQWLHVRGFEAFNEKNEKLFPTFGAPLRRAMDEEVVLFVQDLFQGDRAVTQVLDADYTYLNDALAAHYGIPGVTGPAWRRVGGVKKYGRGGILGFASVQAKQSGASRTSPTLRGNWVVETLLGEKLPRPPADVPKLPEEEGGAGKLTTRQQVERHAADAACAVCHVRVDPFGFALEKYDPIGRRRVKDLGGLAVDARAKLKDGTQFDDIDGLRAYLLAKKKDVIVRLFCQKLFGYSLGRSVTLSDRALIDEMVAALDKNGGRVSAAIGAIVQSKQFRMVRGAGFEE